MTVLVRDVHVIELVVVLDEVVPKLVQRSKALPRRRDIISNEDARRRAWVVRAINRTTGPWRGGRAQLDREPVKEHLHGRERVGC